MVEHISDRFHNFTANTANTGVTTSS